VHKAIDRKLRELQSAVVDVRGADTEFDKLIAEALVDPLMHMIRDALDHAIESADERLAVGKEEAARITIESIRHGNHGVIAVTDDGRSIEVTSLQAKAHARGVVASGEVLNEREALDLIFAPGLSTRGEVTETSGRGVGMDVVRANLTSLGGIVDVESTHGRGTTISMTLPITLAIIHSLIVKAAGNALRFPPPRCSKHSQWTKALCSGVRAANS
jgi:two-component system chemotaxis sensor kinase CheA